MLQRIQSLFLLLASGSFFSLFANPMSLIEVEGNKTEMQSSVSSALADGIFNIYDHVALLGLVVIGGLISFLAIFLFNNRKLQSSISRLALISSVLILLVAGIIFYQDWQLMNQGNYSIEVGFGVLSPFLSAIFTILALKYISQDDKLVKSMDRLR